jgi:NDP-sugar pyrophosphorylase family protein
MEAMILAAGAGTRLRPLTENKPKALIEVADRPLLAWVMQRLTETGVDRLVINTHYHEDQIRGFVARNVPSGVRVVLSPEPDGPYDTGGGLFAAAQMFEQERPFLLHNVDVLSHIPLDQLLTAHSQAAEQSGDRLVATLAVQRRDAQRQLLFDELGLLGWENTGSDRAAPGTRLVRDPVGDLTRWSFTGIHVVDPRVFQLSDRTGTFSIITLYLELASQGYLIAPSDVTEHAWIDVGTTDRLAEANRLVATW